MNKQKHFITRANYVAPECNSIDVCIEGKILTGSNDVNSGYETWVLGEI